jgi:TRAP-type transport system small permease protein
MRRKREDERRMGAITRVSDAVTRLSRGLAWLELLACQLLIAGFAGLLIANVFMRYVFAAPFYFAEELAIYILIWMAYLAIAATIARNEMVALTFAVELLPDSTRLILDILVQLMILAMVVVLFRVSWAWVNSPAAQFDLALTLGLRKWPFYMIMPIFFALASFHTAANLLALLVRLLVGAPPPPPPGADPVEIIR